MVPPAPGTLMNLNVRGELLLFQDLLGGSRQLVIAAAGPRRCDDLDTLDVGVS